MCYLSYTNHVCWKDYGSFLIIDHIDWSIKAFFYFTMNIKCEPKTDAPYNIGAMISGKEQLNGRIVELRYKPNGQPRENGKAQPLVLIRQFTDDESFDVRVMSADDIFVGWVATMCKAQSDIAFKVSNPDPCDYYSSRPYDRFCRNTLHPHNDSTSLLIRSPPEMGVAEGARWQLVLTRMLSADAVKTSFYIHTLQVHSGK